MMKVLTNHPDIDRLFEEWKPRLGRDHTPYRNHVYRVFNLAAALAEASGEDLEKLAAASAFHDVGIWLDDTFDYLEPSIRRARAHLAATGHESRTPSVSAMIDQHHKILPWRGPDRRLVEAFRHADWLDVCLFAPPTRLPRPYLARLLEAHPRKGFHARLVVFTLQWLRRNPLRPLPMFKI